MIGSLPTPQSADDGRPEARRHSPAVGRRGFLALGTAGLAAGALSACGGPSVSTGKSNQGGGSGTGASSGTDWSKVKPAAAISMWSNHPGGSKDIEDQLIKAYNASQSDTKVTLVTAGSSYADIAQKFQTAQTANKGIPGLVVLSDVWWFRYMINQEIIPIDDLVKAVGFEVSDYRTTLWNDYKFNNAHWAVPYARSTPMFYYNTSHWKKVGLPDRAPKTWKEWDSWAPKLNAAKSELGTKTVFNYGSIQNYASWTFQNLFWGWGGAYSDKWDITIDQGPGVAACTWAQKGMTQNGGWAGITSSSQADDFAAGAISATVSSTGSLGGILQTMKSAEVGVGFLPGGPKTKSPVCPTGGSGLGIPKKLKPGEQLAAAKFLKFLTNPENTVKFAAATGYMPVRKSSDTSSLAKKTPQILIALKQLDVTRSQDWARVFLPGGDRDINTAIGKILAHNADVQQTLTAVKGQLHTIYTRDVKPKL